LRKPTGHNELNAYAKMGMAAMLPGLQYAVELMQRNLDDFRAQLAHLHRDQPERVVIAQKPVAG
jgi:hypothetical protein